MNHPDLFSYAEQPRRKKPPIPDYETGLTAEQLREWHDYDPITGIFTRRKITPGFTVGKKSGSLRPDGYLQIKMGGRHYLAHRLAWLHVTGHWPKHEIDHINGIKNDNRFANFRDIPHVYNGRNRRLQKNNTSGRKGVTWNKKLQKWEVAIGLNFSNIYLGIFDDIDVAHAAYCRASKVIHGEFGRTS